MREEKQWARAEKANKGKYNKEKEYPERINKEHMKCEITGNEAKKDEVQWTKSNKKQIFRANIQEEENKTNMKRIQANVKNSIV